MKYPFIQIILTAFILLMSLNLHADSTDSENNPDVKLVYKFDLKMEIGPASWRQIRVAMKEANDLHAEVFLIHMNTYGGMVNYADSIRTAILNYKKPVYVFIDNNAASAGALISIACDSIYMRKGANIGAATVVNQTGQAMPDKYQSYMRSTMRSTAEAHGMDTIIRGVDTTYKWKRDPLIAEAMVDPKIYIETIIDTGMVLSFTPSEAIKNGYCEGLADHVDELLAKVGIEEYDLHTYKASAIEQLVDLMINPILQGILIMVIMGGIYFELQTPGVGFPILASIIAAVLYFSPLYLEGMAANWEIVLFILGIILIAVELFVTPGFGLAGILGMTFSIVGLSLSLIDNFSFKFGIVRLESIIASFLLVIFSSLASIFISIYLTKKMLTSNSFLGRLVLSAEENPEKGYIGVDMSPKTMLGKTGVAMSVLRPSGKVLIENRVYDAKSEDFFIEKDMEVEVVRFESGQIYVVEKERETTDF